MPKRLSLILFSLSLSPAAICQTAQAPCSVGANAATQSAAVQRIGTGTPYTLTAVVRSERKLYDGNTISGFTTVNQARDSQGRTRIDAPMVCAKDAEGQPHWEGSVTVTDPVAGTYTLWQVWLTTKSKVATVTHAPALKVSTSPTEKQEYEQALRRSHFVDPQSQTAIRYEAEDLGRRNVAGLEASGFRLTETVPAGVYGNALPLKNVEDKWISDAYGMILLDIIDRPELGKSTYEVTSFVPGEPEAALFAPPAGYKVEERTLGPADR